MIKSYGIPGESQETRTELDQPAPYVLMSSNRPAPHYVCQVVDAVGVWVEPQAPVPVEVPRWAGLLAIKRHTLSGGELTLLSAEDSGADSIFASITEFRTYMPLGEARDRLDVALDHAKDWTRASPTVALMAEAIGLTQAHLDELFRWADAQAGTV